MRIPCGVYIIRTEDMSISVGGGGRVAVVEVGVKHDNLKIDTHTP